MVVKTRSGGHLGWQESPPLSKDGKRTGMMGGSASWSDVAVADFIEALLQVRDEDRTRSESERNAFGDASAPKMLSKL